MLFHESERTEIAHIDSMQGPIAATQCHEIQAKRDHDGRRVKCLNANKHVRIENCRGARSSSVNARSPKRDATSAPPSNLSSDGPVRRLAQPIPIEQAQEVDAIDAGGAGRCRDVSAV